MYFHILQDTKDACWRKCLGTRLTFTRRFFLDQVCPMWILFPSVSILKRKSCITNDSSYSKKQVIYILYEYVYACIKFQRTGGQSSPLFPVANESEKKGFVYKVSLGFVNFLLKSCGWKFHLLLVLIFSIIFNLVFYLFNLIFDLFLSTLYFFHFSQFELILLCFWLFILVYSVFLLSLAFLSYFQIYFISVCSFQFILIYFIFLVLFSIYFGRFCILCVIFNFLIYFVFFLTYFDLFWIMCYFQFILVYFVLFILYFS